MPNQHESQPVEPQGPLPIGFILEEIMRGDTEEKMAEIPRPQWNLEDNPDLLAIAENDEELASRIEALRRAREVNSESIDDEDGTDRRLTVMDDMVREYATKKGYQWDPYYPETEPPAEPEQP